MSNTGVPALYRVGPIAHRINPGIGSFEFEMTFTVDDGRDDVEYFPKLLGAYDDAGEYVRVSIRDADRLADIGADLMEQRVMQLKGKYASHLSDAPRWRVHVHPMTRIEPLYPEQDEGTAS